MDPLPPVQMAHSFPLCQAGHEAKLDTLASGETLIVKDAVEQAGTNFGIDWSLYDNDSVLVIRYKERAPRKRIPAIFYDSIYRTTEEEQLKKYPPSPTGAHIYKEMIIREELLPKSSKSAVKRKPGKLHWLTAELPEELIASENDYGQSKVMQPFDKATGSSPSDKATSSLLKPPPASNDQLQPGLKLWERIAETIVPLAKKIIAWIKKAFDRIRLMFDSKAEKYKCFVD